jgi:hypothetical protein
MEVQLRIFHGSVSGLLQPLFTLVVPVKLGLHAMSSLFFHGTTTYLSPVRQEQGNPNRKNI